MEELDFRLVFEEDGRSTGPDLNGRTAPSSTQALAEQLVSQELQSFPYEHNDSHFPGPQYGALGNPRTFDCPSIQITSIAPNNHVEPGSDTGILAGGGGAEGGYPEASWSRGQLYLPLDPCYRDPALCPSPCSSLSSRSWMSDLSSCESSSHVYDDVEVELRDAARLALGSPLLARGSPIGSPVGSPGCGGGAFGVELWQQKYQHPSAFSPALSPHQSPRQSPHHSPRTSVTEESWLSRRPTSRPSSRPTSPCGKRRRSGADPHARSPSPHHSPSPTAGASPLGSVTDDGWAGSPAGAPGPLLMAGYRELDVPSKTRRTSGAPLGFLAGQGEPGPEPFPLDSPGEERLEQDGLADLFFQVPAHFSWNKPAEGNPPLFRTSSPPPLDWPLPHQYDQCELKVEVQPRSYHRAHYETEGSRGSLKAAPTGHPVVRLRGAAPRPLLLLLFIGTADGRGLRPHAFYQAHRVTGKTVTTSCHERTVGGTKVLEVPLLPENNMAASIDCAGILKLRNADIELKKGEMDVGRKNTRVRVVFRVAVPQPDGRALWLQTTSSPVECSQRSAQELPLVEAFSPCSVCAAGGEELLIRGSNMSAQSRVVFTEKGSDGRSLWETDARVVPEKSGASRLVVEVPPYNRKTCEPVQVQFYVSNGKRRRSLAQSVTLLPGVKQERREPDRGSHDAPGYRALGPDAVYYDSRDAPVHCGPPRLHHPPPAPLPLQAPPGFPQASALPPQSSGPLQAFTAPPPASSGGPRRENPSPLTPRGAFGPLKAPAASGCSGRSVKREPDDAADPAGLQEITLDDVSEIIDRDIGSLSAGDQFDQFDQQHQYQQYGWQHKASP